jgi:hypothetical protein
MPIATMVSPLRRCASIMIERRPASCAAARAGVRLARSVSSVMANKATPPTVAAKPSQGWMRKQIVRNTGTHGRSTMATGPALVRKVRIWSRSRTGCGVSPAWRVAMASRMTAPCTVTASRRSSTAAARTTTRERMTSSAPWKA